MTVHLTRALTAVRRLGRCCRGATAVEYGFLIALVFVVLTVGVNALGGATHDKWGGIANKVSEVEP